jgi:cysteine desulfurase
MSIYVDNHASSRCDDRVLAAMIPYFGALSEGNPSSSYHSAGHAAASACQHGRKSVSELVGCVGGRVIFTGSATEANNLAVIGSCMAGRDSRGANHVVSTQIEHPSVLRALNYLQTQGFEVSLVAPDALGRISVDEILGCVTDDTILISVMSANNEVGTLQPIEKIAAGAPPNVLIHSDSCQSVGRLPIKMSECGIDLLTIAGHKMHGPKGIGALCVSDRAVLTPQILGNHQEYGLRAGTPNVPGIVGLARACQIYLDEGREESKYVAWLRNTFRDNLLAKLPDVYINGDQEERLPGNLHVSFIGVPSDELMRALPDVCVSSGAACTSGRGQPSHVLSAMNTASSRAESSIRFGFGRFNTQREIASLTDMVVNAVRNIRSKTHCMET